MAALVSTPAELKNVAVLARVKVIRGSSAFVPLTKSSANDGPEAPKNLNREVERVSGYISVPFTRHDVQ
jgi:hypothetical protein